MGRAPPGNRLAAAPSQTKPRTSATEALGSPRSRKRRAQEVGHREFAVGCSIEQHSIAAGCDRVAGQIAKRMISGCGRKSRPLGSGQIRRHERRRVRLRLGRGQRIAGAQMRREDEGGNCACHPANMVSIPARRNSGSGRGRKMYPPAPHHPPAMVCDAGGRASGSTERSALRFPHGPRQPSHARRRSPERSTSVPFPDHSPATPP